MKNVLKSLALVAASALAVVSCQKNELAGQKDGEGIFFSLRTGETKTYIVQDGNKYLPQWAKGDEVGVFFGEFDKGKESPAGTLVNENESGNVAKFEGTISGAPESGTVYAFYPSSALGKTYDGQSIGFDMPSVQHPTATSFDPAADILVAKPVAFTATDGVVNVENMYFARILATLKVNLNSDFADVKNQKVSSFKLEATEATLSGRAAVSMTTADGKITTWNTKNKVVSATYDETSTVAVAGEYNSVFVTINPETIKTGETIKFTIETEGYIITKAIALTSDIVLTPGKLTEINLGIAESNCEEKVAEARIWVENFDKVTEASQATPSQTGAAGTGVTDALQYAYSTTNTNVRVNNNGHGDGNPFLWISGADQYLQISKIVVSGETDLKFSCQVKTTQNTADVTLKYKASTAEEWNTASGKISATTKSIDDVQSLIFTISEDVTSLDLQIVGSAGSLVVDDIVLEKFVDQRTTLTTPANVKAEKDATTSNKVNVTWDAVENAGSYEVTLSTTGEEDVVETVETNSISFTGLKYSTQYSVKVKAISSDVALYKDSEYSATVGVTTGAQPAVLIDWVKKSFADLAAGDEVVIVKTSDTPYAMSNDKGTEAAPTAVEVSVSNDKLGAEPDANIIWYVGVDGSDKIFNKDKEGTAWLYCTGTNNGVRVGTNANKTFTWDDKEYLKHVGTSRYLGVYNDQDWRCYSTKEPSSHTNLKGQAFAFFVKDDPRTALATPEITVTPDNTAKKITVSWTAVDNAVDYTVTCTGQTGQTVTGTSYEFTGLAYGDYTVSVQANPAATSTLYKSSEKASENVSIVDTTPTINASNPAAVEATATSVEVEYTVSNKTDGVNLTAAVTSGDWISNPQVATDKVTFTLIANTTSAQRTGTVTLSYTGAEDKVVTITQKGVGQTGYASLEDLVAAGEPKSGDDAENVTVTFSNKEIKSIYVTSKGYRNGIFLPVNSTVKDEIEIFCYDVPETWVAGGLVSGTLTNCKWTKYNDTWELCPSNWNDISYTAPLPKCETPVISFDGAKASISCATEGATILYEISDTEPASFTKTYSSAITLTDGQTIWAKATKSGNRDSDVVSKKYTAGGGGEKTYTLTLTSSDIAGVGSGSSGYTKYNGTQTWTAKSTDGSTMEVKAITYQVMPQSGKIQLQKSKGYIYNTTDLGSIESVTLQTSTNTTTIIGTSENPESSVNGGGFFVIKATSGGTPATEKITIVFKN